MIDNTRILATKEAGVDIKAKVWNQHEALPENMLDRFKNPVTGQYANTWADAVEARILKQPDSFVSQHYPHGNFEDPMISFNTNSSNINLGN